MNNKYEFTDETIEINGHILHRIIALKDFGDIKKSDLGGWIEKEENLSQKDNCWVGGEAKVYNDARVCEDAQVDDNANIFENAQLMYKACVYGNARIFGKALIYGYSKVYEDAYIHDNSSIFGYAKIFGRAEVYGNADIYGNACVFDNARIYDNAMIYGNVHIFGDAKVFGVAEIIDNAEVSNIQDYMVFKNSWSSGRYFTWTKSNNMWKEGSFYGTEEELIKKSYKVGKNKGKRIEKLINFIKDYYV